jgi:hypothetical protein
MIVVAVYYSTEADGSPVPEDVPMDELPLCYFGPFADKDLAEDWMHNEYPDNDRDVYEILVVDIPDDTDPYVINDPDKLFGEFPDEDIRDDSQELHGP